MNPRYTKTDAEMEALADDVATATLKDTYAGAYAVLKEMALHDVRSQHRVPKPLIKRLAPKRLLRKDGK